MASIEGLACGLNKGAVAKTAGPKRTSHAQSRVSPITWIIPLFRASGRFAAPANACARKNRPVGAQASTPTAACPWDSIARAANPRRITSSTSGMDAPSGRKTSPFSPVVGFWLVPRENSRLGPTGGTGDTPRRPASL